MSSILKSFGGVEFRNSFVILALLLLAYCELLKACTTVYTQYIHLSWNAGNEMWRSQLVEVDEVESLALFSTLRVTTTQPGESFKKFH